MLTLFTPQNIMDKFKLIIKANKTIEIKSTHNKLIRIK